MTGDRGEGGADTPAPYVLAHVRDALATDPRVSELGVELMIAQGTLVLTGRVASDALRTAAAEVAQEQAPGFEIRNELDVVDSAARPADPEQLR